MKTKAGEWVERSSGGVRIKSFDAKERTVDVVCSTDAMDSYGEVVEQKWNLARYKANPVVLYAHKSRELPIGRAENMEVRRGDTGRDQLECTIRFATAEANPVAEQCFQLFAQNILRAVSVGFVPNTVREEKRDGKFVLVLSDNELQELSVTPVPANQEALAKDAQNAARGAAHKDRTMELTQADFDKLAQKHADETRAAAEAHAKAAAAKDAQIAALEGELAAVRVAAGVAKDAKGEEVVKAIAAVFDKALGLEVDSYIGTKLLPHERDDMFELAKSNRPLFERMLKNRKELGLLERALPKPKSAEAYRNSVADETADGEGEDLANAIDARAQA